MTKLTITFLSLLTITACKKTEDKKAGDTKVTDTKEDTKADTKVAAPSAPSSDGKCASGFSYNTMGTFCIKLPPKYAGKTDAEGRESGNGTAKQYGWAGGDSGSDYGITVFVSPMNEEYWLDSIERVKQPPYEGKLTAEGKLEGGGAWATGDSSAPPAGKNQRRWIHTVAKSDKLKLTCEVSRANGTAAPTEAEVFESCKSIVFAKS